MDRKWALLLEYRFAYAHTNFEIYILEVCVVTSCFVCPIFWMRFGFKVSVAKTVFLWVNHWSIKNGLNYSSDYFFLFIPKLKGFFICFHIYFWNKQKNDKIFFFSLSFLSHPYIYCDFVNSLRSFASWLSRFYQNFCNCPICNPIFIWSFYGNSRVVTLMMPWLISVFRLEKERCVVAILCINHCAWYKA